MLKRHISPLIRGAVVLLATLAITTGVTLMVVRSRTVLASGSASTKTSTLQLWNGHAFAATAPGFAVQDITPGIGKEYPLYFKNEGKQPLRLMAHIPSIPAASGFSGWDNLVVAITGEKCGETVRTTMAALFREEVELPCNPLAAGATGKPGVSGSEGNYKVAFDIAPTAMQGSKVSVGNFDITFSGVAQ